MISLVKDVIEGRKKYPVLKGCLFIMSRLFGIGVALRNLAFDRRWFRENRVPVPVISVGNIIAGGSGKTPLILKVARDLLPSFKLAILSRGYCSQVEKMGGGLHLSREAPITPKLCGDEPFLLFSHLPKALFFVGKDRVLNAKRAVEKGAQLILLDDGMQFRYLHRDFEVIVLHAQDLYGKGFFLPRGYLRDSVERLKEAHFIFINHIENQTHFDTIRADLRRFTSAPLIGTRMILREIRLNNGDTLTDLCGEKVGVFCGLGKPESFLKTVIESKGVIEESWILPDHKAPKKREMHIFINKCISKGCKWIICSEKDWVKLPKGNLWKLPLGYLKASLEVVHGEGAYTAFIEYVKQKTQRYMDYFPEEDTPLNSYVQ